MTNRTLSGTERERAVAAAREIRDYKERLALQSRPPGENNRPRIVTGYRSLEQNIKVDRSTSTYTAPRSGSNSNPPAPAPAARKKKKVFGGLFGKKNTGRTSPGRDANAGGDIPAERSSTGVVFDSDEVEIEPIADAEIPRPPVEISEDARAHADRIPPPPGFSEPAPAPPAEEAVAIVAPAGSAGADAPPPTVATGPDPSAFSGEKEKGLIGGLFSKITPGSGNGGRQSATREATAAAGSDGRERRGLFGRIFGRENKAPAPAPTAPAAAVANPAEPPRAIPPPEIPPPPVSTQPGRAIEPTGSGQTALPSPRLPPPSAPQPSRESIPPPPVPASPPPAHSTALSPTPVSPAPPAPISTPSSGAHFLVVKEGAGAPLQSASGTPIRALRPGEVVQFRKKAGTLALVRLPNGAEGYVAAASLRDASFGEAARFYAAGGTRAE